MKTKENLKEMCDIQSGMASAIIQIYLKQVSVWVKLNICFLNKNFRKEMYRRNDIFCL